MGDPQPDEEWRTGYHIDGGCGYAPWPSNGFDLTSVARYRRGPCAGVAASACTFDSRQIVHLSPKSH